LQIIQIAGLNDDTQLLSTRNSIRARLRPDRDQTRNRIPETPACTTQQALHPHHKNQELEDQA